MGRERKERHPDVQAVRASEAVERAFEAQAREREAAGLSADLTPEERAQLRRDLQAGTGLVVGADEGTGRKARKQARHRKARGAKR